MNGKTSLSQVNRFLFCGVLIGAILWFAKAVLIPLTFSIFFAMLFASLSTRIEKAGIHRAVSALLCLLLLVSVLAGIGLLVYWQGKILAQDADKIEERCREVISQLQGWIGSTLHLQPDKQEILIKKQLESGAGAVTKIIKGIFSSIVGLAGSAIMVLIFSFLLLYQRDKYESFFVRVFRHSPPEKTRDVLHKISKVSQQYVTGRALSILIFTVLFTTGFLIVGLKAAFLLALVASLLTIVPYVGSVVGGLFPFAVALVTEDSTNTAFGALVVVLVVQAFDNYFIEPYVIGGEVNISAFFTLLILLVGGLLWGVAGMILFLPMLAVTRIVFEAVPGLEPYAYLIGDQQSENQSKRILQKIRKFFKH